jgi:ring-1,2-phenylacetyl-CoA epoxidase subunit PaaE
VAFHTLTVAEVERLCDDAAAITFDVPAGLRPEYAFAAGQSLALRRVVDGVEERRSYSICAPVGERPRVGVREVPDGLFSSWLVRDVRPGTRIDVQTPSGRFRADPAAGGRHLCVAAGSGITPMLSIASSVLAGSPTAQVTLLYGNRRAATVMFAEELSDLKDRYGARFELVHVLSREPRDVDLLSGRLDAERLRTLLDLLVPLAAVDHVWLCGPYPMVEDARAVLAELGVPAERVHRELFFVDEPPPPVQHAEAAPTGETSEVTLTIDGRSSTAALPRDRSILDGAQAVRSDLPFACKGGVCGTCRARLVTGEVTMRRNYALEEDELAAGYVLTCQSVAASSQITVDYDS